MKVISRLLAILLLLLALPCAAQSVVEQQDASVIENLRAAGSDLSKPHDVDFFYFPGKAQAEAAAAELSAASYEVVAVESAPKSTLWQIHAKRSMALQLEAMNATTRALEALASRYGGDYDGWGTAVVE
ncbi:ribonuclease E inhibitor RraB [Lysobacter korlensis]|uniref:Ribonuclease E inhibitor RraB n=1 Tax=Lysobacter korlensis TaxID=553636 RepID=A0ABV6RZX6_9GAMM